MKYMLLMQASEPHRRTRRSTPGTPPTSRRTSSSCSDFNEQLVADGEFVDAQGLAGPEEAKVVRAVRTARPR